MKRSATSPVPGRWGRVLERPWFWVLVVIVVFGIPLYRSFTRPLPRFLPVIGELDQFDVVDQDAKLLPPDWLRGAAIVIGFVDTPCDSPQCQSTLERMTRLQNRLLSVGFTVRILSWGRDATRDTPERLKALGQSRSARFKIWTFISGPLPESLKPAAEAGDFVLVDQLGRLRWQGPLPDAKSLNDLVREIAILLNSDSALPQ